MKVEVLAWKLKKRIAQNTIHKIKDPVTKTTKNKLNEILGAFETFHMTLYTKKAGDSIAEIDIFFGFSGITSVKCRTEKNND